jgi:p-methyltransferase
MAEEHVLSSLSSVRYELEALRATGTRFLVFVDDTFNVPLPRFKNLLRVMVDNGYEFRWISFLRCSNLDEAALDLMQASGCLGVFLGIESGDQRILDLMHKAAKLERYRWGIEQLHRRGIATFASLICGFPGETAESVMNTIAFVEETGPTFFNVQLYYHDRCTPIQRRAAELGIRGGGYSWSHDTMTWREAARGATPMFEAIRSSLPITLHGFSLWGIHYLVSKGMALERIEAFARTARDLLLASLQESEVDSAPHEARLASLFSAPLPEPERNGWHTLPGATGRPA